HAFVREQNLAEAAVSRRDVELSLEMGDAPEISAELCARVARYNAEDCLSTEALRTWLELRRAQHISQGASIDRPPAQVPEPTEEVKERDRRIQELRDALTAGLPEKREDWSPEHEGIALLASLLGYFRQEDKNAWWEHFRLRDLPADEQMNERHVLAGLEFDGIVPKVGRQQSDRRRYRFPPQECTIGAGDKVVFTKHEDPAGLTSVGTGLTVEELDAASSTVVLNCSKFVPNVHPTAVFAKQVVGAEALEAALLAFGDHVSRNSFATTGPYAAASALLLRKPPRPSTPGAPLRQGGEEAIVAAKRIAQSLDHEVLPIQGPPGSGKTFTGARMVLELVRAGKRV